MSIEGTAQTEYASLSGKIHTFVVDKTLSISGACADAKATGEAIAAANGVKQSDLEAAIEASESKMQKAIGDHEDNKKNPHGVTAEQVGAYTKELVLSDDTKAAYSLGTDAVPDDVLAKLAEAQKGVRNIVIEKIYTSQTWTAPKAVGQVFRVYAVGGGGGGGGIGNASYPYGSGGGAGGGIAISNLAIEEGTEIDVVCGAGGVYGNGVSADGGTGGTTSFGSLLSAAGGAGGKSFNNGGYGGDATGGGGGGAGYVGGNATHGGAGGTYGGGGGGMNYGGSGGTYGGGGGASHSGYYPTNNQGGGAGGTYGGAGGGGKTNGSVGVPFVDNLLSEIGRASCRERV